MTDENINHLKEQLRYEITRIIRGDLDDVERNIKNNDSRRALSDLDSAVTKLKRLANNV